jgi:NDP-sugar pyrophosphorylase family protein
MLPIAVLCGGKGTRIAALAGDLPKALVQVAGRPFIVYQLTWLHRAGARDVVLLTGYGADRIKEFVGSGEQFGLRVRYSDDGDAPRGTGGALARALPLLGDRFLTLYGDSLPQLDIGAVGDALGPGDEGVMTVYRNEDRELPSNARVAGDRVSGYDKQAPPGTMTHIDYGVNAFRAEAFASVPGRGAVDLGDVHRAMISRDALRAFPVQERWFEIGSPDGLAQTEAFVRARFAPGDPV